MGQTIAVKLVHYEPIQELPLFVELNHHDLEREQQLLDEYKMSNTTMTMLANKPK